MIRKILSFSLWILLSCFSTFYAAGQEHASGKEFSMIPDTTFYQEFHDLYRVGDDKDANDVRGIAVDDDQTVWITTAAGVFRKMSGRRDWEPVIEGEERGPAFDVHVGGNGVVLFGTWDGLYLYSDGFLTKAAGIESPISAICGNKKITYVLGPKGIWKYHNKKAEKVDYPIARSVRDAMVDENQVLWVATDAGLYRCDGDKVTLLQDTTELISAYTSAVAAAPGNQLWAGGMGGVSVREDNRLKRTIRVEDGLPSAFVNCVKRSPGDVMWVGTNLGVVREKTDGSYSLLFSRRWLAGDKVNDIAFDREGNAWLATEEGVSAIRRKPMTLNKKQDYFYDQLMRKHIREPWICGVLRLDVPGDTTTWHNSDDDNDGEYTGGYLAMESFRYAVTGDEDARIKARKAFDFLRFLQTVTGTEGFFARTIVPVSWTKVHDPNRTYSQKEIAEAMVRDPRYKPVEQRWHLSADGKWRWKGDTSSDEMDGHMMSYFYYYELAAGEEEKQLIRDHVIKIMDQLMANGYNLVDVDGKHTRWGVWSPEQLNRDPDWASEKSLNSFELLAYLKFAEYITGDPKYDHGYQRLIKEEGYLDNVSKLNHKNPAWKIYFDLTMEGYLFPMLVKCEKDPKLRAFYLDLMEEWMRNQPAGENLINNLLYTYATGRPVNVAQTVSFLKETPLDLTDWRIDHTRREDVQIVRHPIMEELQVSELPPPAIRATVRWDKNPWSAIQGDPAQVREPVFWLWPFWMARYCGIIGD